ncbi:alpha/beta hydrolase [Aspergillus stella-maris]|uniref:alpha/beta hydrolase n=1 Tax=Aspergillus stella-maris TaxID=1810926 RepID=UPI003CCCAF8F
MAPTQALRPTIVFIPGAWHTPATFDLLLPPLHAAGYPTTSVHLPSTGAVGPVKYAEDVSAIRKVVAGLVEMGQEVVVVAHSYGGCPSTDAVAGLGRKNRTLNLVGGVTQLIYIAGLVPTKGNCVAEALGAFGNDVPREKGGPWMEITDMGGGLTTIANPEQCFYHDLPPELAKYHASLLRTHYSPTSSESLEYEAYRDIPAAYIYCEDDRAFPLQRQKQVVEATGIRRTISLKTSHFPFFSDPNAVAGFIRQLLEEPPWANKL